MHLMFKNRESQLYGANIVELEVEMGTLRFIDDKGKRQFEISAPGPRALGNIIESLEGLHHWHTDQYDTIKLLEE